MEEWEEQWIYFHCIAVQCIDEGGELYSSLYCIYFRRKSLYTRYVGQRPYIVVSVVVDERDGVDILTLPLMSSPLEIKTKN